MALPVKLAEVAFKMHAQARVDRAQLVAVLETYVNLAAIENSYSDSHGMPFPDRRSSQRDEDEADNYDDEDNDNDEDEDEDEEDDEDDDQEEGDDEVSV